VTDADPTVEQAAQAEAAAKACADAAGVELNHRLWLRAIRTVLELAAAEPDPSPRVRYAVDRMIAQACERCVRILGSDQAADHTDGS
jgi:hypothetical protein